MSHLDKGIITRATAEDIVVAYNKNVAIAKQAYQDIDDATKALKAVVPHYSVHLSRENLSPIRKSDRIKLDKAIWYHLIHILGIERLATDKRMRTMRELIEEGQMPEITVGNVFDQLTMLAESTQQMSSEIIHEAYRYLTTSYAKKNFKTNERYEIGKKVITTGWVSWHEYNKKHPFSVEHRRANRVLALDKAMSLLDGKGVVEGYVSPLADAIGLSPDGAGETEYFKFKCFKKGGRYDETMHIAFKRMELIDKMNAMCGDGSLKGEE